MKKIICSALTAFSFNVMGLILDAVVASKIKTVYLSEKEYSIMTNEIAQTYHHALWSHRIEIEVTNSTNKVVFPISSSAHVKKHDVICKKPFKHIIYAEH